MNRKLDDFVKSFVTAFVLLLVVGVVAQDVMRWRPQARVLYQAWGWVQGCTSSIPERGLNPYRDLANVYWKTFTPGALDDSQPGHVIGVTVATRENSPVDTIYIDAVHQDTVWVLAHELLHHVLADSTVWGTAHPFVPFAFPCHLFEWQQNGIGILGQGHRPPRVRIP